MARWVHSYWSRPALCNRWGIDSKNQTITNMWYFATSVAYLKRLNKEVVLHTDDFGKSLFSHIPYDKVFTTLNEIPTWMHPSIFACSKMYAMKHEPLDSIHIDGDVFIKSEECIKDRKPSELLIQNIENAEVYRDSFNVISHFDFPEWSNKELTHSYNTGILSFGDPDFKNEFLKTYFKMSEKISKDKTCREMLHVGKHLSPDLILEQKFIYDLAQSLKTPVKTITDYKYYQHVLGSEKYDQLSICKRVLKKLNPELYSACELKEIELENGNW